MDKSGFSFSPIDLIAGLIVISGGVAIIFNYVNLGSFIASLGLIIEILEIMIKGGLK